MRKNTIIIILLALTVAAIPAMLLGSSFQSLSFSHPPGLHAEAFDLTLATGLADGIIRYTTDGSDPDADSAAYVGPIPIRDRTDEENSLSATRSVAGGVYANHFSPPATHVYKGNVIKAQVFSATGEALSDVVTHSYFIGRDFGTLVLASLAVDADDFMDIYGNPNYHERGRQWERPVHFELFDPLHRGGGAVISLNMGLRIHGGYTRNSPMKSLRLYAREEYEGSGIIKYDIFDGRATNAEGGTVDEFRRLLLRNAGTDAWGALMRCALASDLLRHDTAVPYQAYRQAAVFINGEFWGLYNIREQIDIHGIAGRYGLEEARDVALLSVHGPYGDGEYDEDHVDNRNYAQMWEWFDALGDVMDDDEYALARRYLDMDNFIDYYVFNIFIGNTDWPAAHHTLWRYRPASYPTAAHVPAHARDGRWRFHAHDLDYSLAPRTGDPNLDRTVLFNPYLYLQSNDSGEEGFSYGYGKSAEWGTLYWRKLSTNGVFAEEFLARYCDLLNFNFSAPALLSAIDVMQEGMRPHVAEHWDRNPTLQGMQVNWRGPGFAGDGSPLPEMSHAEAYGEEIGRLMDFARRRHNILEAYTRDFFHALGHDPGEAVSLRLQSAGQGHIVINGIPIVEGSPGVTADDIWQGRFFTGMEIHLLAAADAGSIFDGWYEDGQKISTERELFFPAAQRNLEARFRPRN